LPSDERLFPVGRGPGRFGQANVWYADGGGDHPRIRADVLRYIETREPPGRTPASKSGAPRQADPLIRQEVERAAVNLAFGYYERLGYEVKSVEADNVGWDLEAVHADRALHLKIEVKGLSGADCAVELTPNEYRKMRDNLECYRICVVTSALSDPALAVFAFSADSHRWEDQAEAGRVLTIEEVVAARCLASRSPPTIALG
jgi:hypothetical protein